MSQYLSLNIDTDYFYPQGCNWAWRTQGHEDTPFPSQLLAWGSVLILMPPSLCSTLPPDQSFSLLQSDNVEWAENGSQSLICMIVGHVLWGLTHAQVGLKLLHAITNSSCRCVHEIWYLLYILCSIFQIAQHGEPFPMLHSSVPSW